MTALLARAWKLLSLPKNLQIALMRATQDEFLIGVTGVILNTENEILICKHTYRGKTGWSLPGGYIKAKEHPKEGLAREIEEETGLIVRIEEQFRLRTDRETARIDISLIGKYVGGEFKKSGEVSEARFFKFEDLPLISKNQLLLIREILDRKSQPAKPLIPKERKLSFFDRVKFLVNPDSSKLRRAKGGD
ncbi:MAG TPA: NUDIX hydrolase [Patescibacteria group bacterium]|nr:NUDIX hydrolase [Patescibacteria group bacterium]